MPTRDYGKEELRLVKQVLASGRLSVLSGGKMQRRFERAFARAHGVKHAVAMNSAMSVSTGACPNHPKSDLLSMGVLATLAHQGDIAVRRKTAMVPVPHGLALGTEVVVLAQAVGAFAADIDARLACHPIADGDLISYLGALLYYHTAELVTYDHRSPNLVIDGFVVKVQIRTTDTGGFDFDFYLLGPGRLFLDFPQFYKPVAPARR